MKRIQLMLGMAVVFTLATGLDSQAQRGGRGGGRGGGGGGGRPAGGVGGGAPSRPSGPVGGSYNGGARPTTHSSGSVVGPAGGTRSAGSGSGSRTTQGGSTINYAGAGRGGTTPGGVDYGRGVGGVQVTTPGGKTATKVGAAGGAAGPGGNAVGGRAGVATGSGPGGSFSTAYKGGVAVGPHGAAAGGGRVGTATGPGGTVSGATRAGVANGPYGAAARAGAGAVAVGAGGTYYRSAAAVNSQAVAVRQNFRNFAQEYPGLTARWIGPTWRPVAWGALASYGGYAAEPAYYDYGESVVYSGDTVVVNGTTEIPAEQYAEQATEIATTGAEAMVDPKVGEWQPLGVFAMVGEGEEKSTNIFQLAINKDGIIRGEYYNALTDETTPVKGAVDKKTQRAAWTVADRKTPVYEAGIANLTKDETTMLVHYSKDKAQQYTLVRIEKPEGEAPAGGK